ncbi:hypothetical protein NLI96_g5091 [Meripilus lineatus]|uniref:Uncharacterized protein n=1 Tax=Meripilus lineatus TaxID=2056292 RepID=A0AAD5YE78_9APHY|nr:hypothetical protein NLI96_g5091 [Physisporinus lineatus]
MASTPASILANALSSLTKAANLAFSQIEEQAKSDVADARRDRDEAMKALHEIQLQEREWHRRVDGWKTSLDRSDTTIQHQSEMITRLKEEAHQSRREMQDWKEQYLRVEQERSRLLERIDGLVTQNAGGDDFASRFPSRKIVADAGDPSTSAAAPKTSRVIASSSRLSEKPIAGSQSPRKSKPATKKPNPERARTETLPRPNGAPRNAKNKSATEVPEDSYTIIRAPPSRPSSAPRQSISQRELQSVQPRQTIVRRVHAVLEVPVKEESDNEGDNALSDNAQSEGSDFEPPPKRRTSTSKGTAKTRVRRRSSVKGKQVARSEIEAMDEDEEHWEELPMSKSPHSRLHVEDDDSDDDELAIGAESDHHELYGTRPVVVTAEVNGSQRNKTTSRQAGVSKKRKLDNEGVGTPRGPAKKVARKKQ